MEDVSERVAVLSVLNGCFALTLNNLSDDTRSPSHTAVVLRINVPLLSSRRGVYVCVAHLFDVVDIFESI